MATLTAQKIVLGGVTPSYAASDVAGETFSNTGDVFLHVKNGDASPHNVTIVTQATTVDKEGYGSITLSSEVIAVANAGEEMIGPFPQSRFNDPSGDVSITYDDVTSMTVALIKLPKVQ